MNRPVRGHCTSPHTADLMLEAWGSTFAICCEEAVAALVEICVDASRAEVVQRTAIHLSPGPAESLLLELLDEVIYLLDTEALIPVGAEVRPGIDGGLIVEMLLAARNATQPTGAAPKGLSRSEFRLESDPSAVRCTVLVDV